MKRLLNDPVVQKALEFLRQDDGRTLQEQLELVIIPAPTNEEGERAQEMARRFRETGLAEVTVDAESNVLGTIKGTADGPCVVLSAHLDTVFPSGTELTPMQWDGAYRAPGINDDTRGLVELLTIARAILSSGIRPVRDLIFFADAGEEGLGDLRGTRYFFKTRKDISAFITIDDGNTGMIIHGATGSLRYRVMFSGTGGHSFSDFGMPNPIHAMGRAISKIAEIQVPDKPRTTFSVGIVEGGTSVNAIASSASMLVDSRSSGNAELLRLGVQIHDVVEEAVKEENRRWNQEAQVEYTMELIGNRPGGQQSAQCPLACLAAEAVRAVGLEPVLMDQGSTDANIPISMGIPAIAVGRGGEEGGIHTELEWFRPVEAYKGPQKDLLLLLAAAGVEGICEPADLTVKKPSKKKEQTK